MNSNLIFRRPARIHSAQRITGSTLTEVLITVVILSLGMLTAARMLNDSLQLLGDSRYQQRAVRLAADLAELLSNTSASLASAISTPASHDCENSICSPQQFLEHNLHYWDARAAQLMPDGSIGFELVTAAGHARALITVHWSPRGSTAASYHTQTTLLPDP